MTSPSCPTWCSDHRPATEAGPEMHAATVVVDGFEFGVAQYLEEVGPVLEPAHRPLELSVAEARRWARAIAAACAWVEGVEPVAPTAGAAEGDERPQQAPFYTARAAAKYLGISEGTIHRALRCTIPSAYPPPLEYDGRHGEGGKYHIPHDALVAWSKKLARFG